MEKLKKELGTLLRNAKIDPKIVEFINSEKSLFPFSKESRLLAYLLSKDVITYEKYMEIIRQYEHRNQYLDLFDMAPRTFGQTWGETHILNLFPQFIKATKENVSSFCPDFDGEFDLWVDGVRVEVKACRANSTSAKGSLSSRAYLHSDAAAKGFKYHFQQLKPSCCDVFIWIGVCRDELIYWVLTSDELLKTGKLGPQHRNENTGAEGKEVFEGQVFMTEEELAPFRIEEQDILKAVLSKGKKL